MGVIGWDPWDLPDDYYRIGRRNVVTSQKTLTKYLPIGWFLEDYGRSVQNQ